MDDGVVTKWAVVIMLAILLYLSYLVVAPFLSYLLLSVVLVMIFHPAYRWVVRRTRRPRLGSLLLVIALILLLVIPSILVGIQLVRSAPGAYESFVTQVDFDLLENAVSTATGGDFTVDEFIRESSQRVRAYSLDNAGEFVGKSTEIVIGLFLVFFVMYYLFVQGDYILARFKEAVPVPREQQDTLLEEIDQVVHGIIEGQIVTGIVQGVIGGLLFWALGLPNALFWGFVMVIFSTIPFLGSFVVWLPAAVWLLVTGHFWQAIVLLIGGVIISWVDNFLRPYLVGRYAEVHPALVLIGVLGGLAAFGFIGFVIGPLILALLVAMLRFVKRDVNA